MEEISEHFEIKTSDRQLESITVYCILKKIIMYSENKYR